jgi:hypothetical protein
MAWFRKKPDPISDRARALNDEIAQLEAEIKRLGSRAERDPAQPRLRPAAVPHGTNVPHALPAPGQAPAATEPIFEEVKQDWLKAREDANTTPDHYNDLGVRKYDLPAVLRRLRNQLRGPSTTNPKLVSYLAAGGIQGLRPLRYEKRVARNRFLVSVAILLLALLGTLWVFLRHR